MNMQVKFSNGITLIPLESRLLETFHSSVIAAVTKRRVVEKYKPVQKTRIHRRRFKVHQSF